MFLKPFNTNLSGVIACEIKLLPVENFIFLLGKDGDCIYCKLVGDNIEVGDSSAGTSISPLTIIDSDRFGIEYDTANGNYKIIHRTGTTDTELATGTLAMSGDVAFIGLVNGFKPSLTSNDFEIVYSVGAKDPYGVTI